MLVPTMPTSYGNSVGNDNYGAPSQSWYAQSVWHAHNDYNSNAWGVPKPQSDKSQYHFAYQQGGRHDGGQMTCGNQWVCGTTASDGANHGPVPVASDLPNAFNTIVHMCHSFFDYFEQTQDQMHRHTAKLAQQVAFTQDSMGTLARDVQSRPNLKSRTDWQSYKNSPCQGGDMYGQFGQKDFGGNWNGNFGSQNWNGQVDMNMNGQMDMNMMRQMDHRLNQIENAFKHLESMHPDFMRGVWKDNKFGNNYSDCDMARRGCGNNYNDMDINSRRFGNNKYGNNFNDNDMGSHQFGYEMQFRNTLQDGEFFERWHCQDQRLWKLEQWFMEMAQRMNFSDMEMQMGSWMQSHENKWNSMCGMRNSWMDSKKQLGNFGNWGNNFGNSFSKGENYCNGNSYDRFNNYGTNYSSNGKNFQIAPPSGNKGQASRPGFANRFNNSNSKSGGMHDNCTPNRFNNFSNVSGGNFNNFPNVSSGTCNYKPGAMYDDSMNNRFHGNFSSGMCGSKPNAMYDDSMNNRFHGNFSGGMCGSKTNAMYDDSMNNRFNGNFSSGMCGSKPNAMYDDSMNNRFHGNFSGGMCGSKPNAMYDDGFCGMQGSKSGGMTNGQGNNVGVYQPRGANTF